MGSSQKKKNERKKDFQKTRLKVGKTKPKPSNFTDTSFRSQAIVLNQQSLTTSAPSASSQFTHYLSLLNSKSDSQRKDSLSYLTTAIASRPVNSPLPQPVSVILPSLVSLILDGSNGVRNQLIKLLKSFPAPDMEGHISQLLPYVRAGMTHLAVDIRLSSVEIISWLVAIAGREVVSSPGGWIKTINCFLSILGWHTEESVKWSSNRASFGKTGSDGKPMVRTLQALAEFLRAGIGAAEDESEIVGANVMGDKEWNFPLTQTSHHILPTKSAPFAYLNLFGQPKNEEGEMYETREDRFRIFSDRFLPIIERGINMARQEGGEIGRASAGVKKILNEALALNSDP
ncbi:pre-rRNA-processing protein ipi1 [Histoplasma capsulatum]|uniref:Pre-rRNA-processing protein n=1 Tax=Ajellomyces capsulatus TaxID=5037 RepID=A0A8A1M4S8_AJECA|nr:pre-rRNA-processing protein ipi1 [Histoplasma capsulatum]